MYKSKTIRETQYTLKHFLCFGLLTLFFSFLFSCTDQASHTAFRQIPASESGLTFQNTITDSEDFNILNFHYIYNGGGVGVGDFDNNGLPDLVFSGNQVQSKIYLNRGDLKFEDISNASGIEPDAWNTGVAVIDINRDGLQDIYLSTGGLDCTDNCKNYLFINTGNDENGVPQFEERAEGYGLQDGLYTQQAAFFDYDLDGDLDVYLLHNVIDRRDKNAPSGKQFINKKSKDILLENRYSDSLGHAFFYNVSVDKGIRERGYGLGVTINDFNNDGRPDIYVANDFLSEDILYINKAGKGGTAYFENQSDTALKHTSYNAMGVDATDVNGDNLSDIVVLDMLPETNERRKSMLGFMNYDKFELAQRQGYKAQFIQNSLQLNNGSAASVGDLPFSEVGYYAGISATDWSWTPLLADFDNDGDNDLYVTNGYGKDITDLDFINYSSQSNAFGSKETAMQKIYSEVRKMSDVEIPNYYFENEGELKFSDKSKTYTAKVPSISNGAVYADLDGDGDLDIVANNINAVPFLLENNLAKEENNHLRVRLSGKGQANAMVRVHSGDKVMQRYSNPTRGYLSTVEPSLHFGLGIMDKVDSVSIRVGQKNYSLPEPDLNRLLEINLDELQANTVDAFEYSESLFEEAVLFKYEHRENQFQDYDAQPLLLRQNSREGPCLAASDINAKPGDEVFIGGAKGIAGRIYTQSTAGEWTYNELSDKESEDTDAAFFDADGDGDLDLYVVSGGTEFQADDVNLKDRLYLNDGVGNFTKNEEILAQRVQVGSCVVTFSSRNEQGRLFVGSKCIPGAYPAVPESQLFIEHQGRYLSHTDKFAYDLSRNGMVSDAVAADFDGDGQDDLITVGEWTEPAFFKGQGDGLEKTEVKFLSESGDALKMNGLWRTIEAADLDQDGDVDFILGNQGTNSRLQASQAEPLQLYKGDYDDNGSKDPLVAQYFTTREGQRINAAMHSRDDVVKQLVKVKARIRNYRDFGKAEFAEVLPKASKEDFFEVEVLESVWLEAKGNAVYVVHLLPAAVQFAPVNAIFATDVNEDGNPDLLVTGNDYGAESNGGWKDATNGLVLLGKGEGAFQTVSTLESGFFVPGDGRDIIEIKDKDGKAFYLVGQNSGELKVFSKE